MSTSKSIASQVLSTATLASFALPGIGVVLAAGIGTFNLLFDIFFPDAPTDPSAAPATQADLTKAISDLANKVDESLWQAKLDDLRYSVSAQNDLFKMFWNSMSLVKLGHLDVPESSPGKNDSATFIQDEPPQYLVDELKTYFNLGQSDNVFVNMDKAFKVCGHPAGQKFNPAQLAHRKAENTDLYCLVASTLIAFFKARVIWEWSHNQVLKWNRYEAYLKDYDYRTDPIYAKNHPPVTSPLEPGEAAPKDAPDFNEWKKSGVVPDLLSAINEILLDAEGDGTACYPGLYTTLVRNWYKDRPNKIADRVGKLLLQTDGTSYWYQDFDAKGGGISPKVGYFDLAALHMEAKAGALIAYWWDYWSEAFAIDNVKESALTDFAQILDLWKQARASVSFTAYPVVKGDTLSSIAKKHYGSELYNKSIFDANRSHLQAKVKNIPNGPPAEWDRVILDEEGQVLNLPDQEEVDFFIYEMAPNDKYPDTLCLKFFQDRTLRGPLDDVNPDIDHNHPIAAGRDIRIPVLPETPQVAARFTFYKVIKGDTLSSIATAQYGSSFYDVVILDTNRRMLKIKDYNVAGIVLTPNTVIRLLDKTDVGFSFYTVKTGDTLKSIATDQYGSWLYDKAIFDANLGTLHIKPPAQGDPPADWDRVTLTGGECLRIVDKVNVDFQLFTTVPPPNNHQYPGYVCEKFYGKSVATFRAGLNLLNAANLDIPNPGKVGIEIRIPFLS